MIIVKKATLENLQDVLAVECEGFPPEQAATEKSLTYRMNNYGDFIRMAIVNDKIVGYYCARPVNAPAGTGFTDEMYEAADYPEGTTLALMSITTLKEYQNQGIATLMMYQMIDLAAQKGMIRIILACKDELIKYYEKFGFTLLGKSASEHGGVTWNDMELYLEDAYMSGGCSGCH